MRPGPTRRAVPALGLALASLCALACACASTPSAADADADAPADTAPIPDTTLAPDVPDPVLACAGGSLRVVSVTPWPGGGFQLVIDGEPAAALSVESQPPGAFEVAVGSAPAGPGLTGVLFAPSSDPSVHASRIAAAIALIEALPAAERTPVWLASPGAPLLADALSSRAHVIDRLAAVPVAAPGAPSTINPADVARLQAILATLELPSADPADRRLVIAADAPAPRALHGVSAHSLAPGDPAALAQTLAAARAALTRVGLCPARPAPAPTEVTVTAGATTCTLALPDPVAALAAVPCDPAAAARADFPYGDTIAIRIAPADRPLYDEASAKGLEDPFAIDLAIGDAAPEPGTAHFRGQSSLGCARKSFSVNLDGGDPRPFGPGLADDELYLVSLCLDDGYFRQVLANRLYGPLGLFPLAFRYVRVLVDGADQGVYMALSQPDETLPRQAAGLRALVRRRFDPEDKPEDVKLPKDAAAATAALAKYRDIAGLIDKSQPEILGSTLDATMDFDGYLGWLAFQTLFRNGDFVDEVYFYASDEPAGGGWYWRVHGWDTDDLFSDCHHGGKFAFDDPAGLIYCAEGDLDLAMWTVPGLYARYVERLERLMDVELPVARVEGELAAVRGELMALLERESTCRAMTELGAAAGGSAPCEAVRAAIDQRIDAFSAEAAARRTSLRAAISAWRAGSP
ncbi:MAG: CotH kinase family protein [Myxococcota bacterium]